MKYQNIFKRYEMKYLVTDEQRRIITEKIRPYMMSDEWGRSTICNLYYDTPDYRLIRKSIEKPVYKEKLRLRSYGTAQNDSTVFIELKKKYRKVVYKRRIPMKYGDAFAYLQTGVHSEESQLLNETDYFLKFYGTLEPRVFISYEREAFFMTDNHDFRLTFDSNIVFRCTDLSLCSPVYGEQLLEDGFSLMEIKTGLSVPLEIVKILNEVKIFRTSFSKYGTVYMKHIFNKGANNNDTDI